jgi:hypothetical protein
MTESKMSKILVLAAGGVVLAIFVGLLLVGMILI